jgi:hypothetical protein
VKAQCHKTFKKVGALLSIACMRGIVTSIEIPATGQLYGAAIVDGSLVRDAKFSTSTRYSLIKRLVSSAPILTVLTTTC